MTSPVSNNSRNAFVGGNYFDKYRSKNPIHRMLMRGFLNDARAILRGLSYTSILEVGCGPGDLAAALGVPQANYLGIDIDPNEVEKARLRHPELSFAAASVYNLPVAAASVDLVIACEVLEHLDDPTGALAEIERVAKEWILISVPWEPVWRILNLARGKYWMSIGNTPGHVQHFSQSGIRRLVQEAFEIAKVRTPFPWTMILARKI